MRISERQLSADIKAGRLARVYMLYGEEDFLIRTYTDMLVSLAVSEDTREMNFQKYSLMPGTDKGTEDDRPPTIDELSDIVDSMPFFADHKCVLLKNFDPSSLSKEELEGYIALINDIPDTSVVIFTRERTEDDVKKFRDALKKAGMTQLINAVNANGIVCELNPLKPDKLADKAIRKCLGAGCGLSKENAAFLVDRVGSSLSLLRTEVEKLCAYKGSGEITEEDIDALVPKRIESNIYALAKELFAGRVGCALEILDALLIRRFEPVYIMSVLSAHFVDLYRAKLGIDAAKSTYDTTAAFKYKYSRAVTEAYGAARPLSAVYLGSCIAVLYNASKRVKTAKSDRLNNFTKKDMRRHVIERAIVEISALPR